eukprot:COSAG06_NODE_2414_length_6916_cov_66.899956_1_plen_27_part_10
MALAGCCGRGLALSLLAAARAPRARRG